MGVRGSACSLPGAAGSSAQHVPASFNFPIVLPFLLLIIIFTVIVALECVKTNSCIYQSVLLLPVPK